MLIRFSSTLLLAANLLTPLIQAQESNKSSADDRQTETETNGVSVSTTITTPGGKPIPPESSPVKVIQRPGAPGQPNSVVFRFERPDGTNLFIAGERGADTNPTTMRQTRIGDYRTDGVFFAGDMWRSMKKWGVQEMLGSIDLRTYKPEQKIREFADDNGLKLAELRLMNPLVDVDKLSSETPLCIGQTHRVLPGEDLAFLANLYQTNEATLRNLNAIKPGASLVWRKIRVPAVIELGRSGFSFYQVRYAPRDRKPAVQMSSYVKQLHRVSGGEDWNLIAKKYGQSVSAIQLINGLATSQKLTEGMRLVVKSRVTLAEGIRPEWLVKELESTLGLDLNVVLRLNSLDSPLDFVPGEAIDVPELNQP